MTAVTLRITDPQQAAWWILHGGLRVVKVQANDPPLEGHTVVGWGEALRIGATLYVCADLYELVMADARRALERFDREKLADQVLGPEKPLA